MADIQPYATRIEIKLVMKEALVLAALIAGFAVTPGCKKRETPPPITPVNPVVPQAQVEGENGGVAPQAIAPEAENQDIGGNIPALEIVNNAISDFFAANGRAPRDVNELVQGKYLQRAPTPPAGRKIVIDQVKRQAKLSN
jgi:hypothetical protein